MNYPTSMEEYHRLRREYELEVPERFNYARDVVDVWAAKAPGKQALLAVSSDGEHARSLTFGELSDLSARVARFLADHGVGKGDRVFVMLPRVPEWHLVMLGCFRIGAVPVPGTTQLTARDIDFRLERSSAVAVVTDVDGIGRVDDAKTHNVSVRVCVDAHRPGWIPLQAALDQSAHNPAAVADTLATDPLLIYFTSGTTGHPKMVLHTHASLGIGHDVTARFWMDLRPDDLHWTLSDTGWAKAAWGMLFGQWRIGATVFLWDGRGKPELSLILRLIGTYRITTFCAPPTLYRGFAQLDLRSFDWSSLRHVIAAGEPLDAETITVWRNATGLTIHDGYGQTETANLVANLPGMPVKPGSMGLPTPGFDVHVVDSDGRRLAPGDEGQLAVAVTPHRPVGLFAEYWSDPERTADAFRNGYYYTGDRAVADDEGYLWFVARDDDIIISAGYRIGPFEIESALVEHPAVVEAAVVGVPDRERGQVVRAYVVLATGHTPSDELARDIQDHVKSVTAPYKYPRQVEFLDELPKTVSGKIRRVELRQRSLPG
jgi:acyl-coenzyme A synthetase/AMP-(fatty) acid ligase